MCGIAGMIGLQVCESIVKRMLGSMQHRGPDDYGVHHVRGVAQNVVLGSVRLAIIDLSPAGHMPMVDETTGNVIVFNGEIYNFPELRHQMEASGELFRSATDTEVVLKAYKRWGLDCLKRFRGMFAFAIWDNARQEVFLARDRLGKKPLYYTRLPNGNFLFASEVKALLASECVDRKLSPDALRVFLWNGFTVAPYTMIDGIYSLLPGYWMKVKADGSIEMHRYWQLPPSNLLNPIPSAEQIRKELETAARIRLISDVPLGVFLYGEIDSSTLVAILSRYRANINTFSITFSETQYDEGSFADWVANRFAAKHTSVRLTARDFTEYLSDALSAMDQPTFDGINTYCTLIASQRS